MEHRRGFRVYSVFAYTAYASPKDLMLLYKVAVITQKFVTVIESEIKILATENTHIIDEHGILPVNFYFQYPLKSWKVLLISHIMSCAFLLKCQEN